MGNVTLHNTLDPEAAGRFAQGVHEALASEEGSFAAWMRPEGTEVTIHIEEPARKESLGNVVETWKRSAHLPRGASVDEIRQGVRHLLAGRG
jgi:hypothetical protein